MLFEFRNGMHIIRLNLQYDIARISFRGACRAIVGNTRDNRPTSLEAHRKFLLHLIIHIGKFHPEIF